jgi:ABC-type nitrate/sulfonate/bicarbonate transport system permease component
MTAANGNRLTRWSVYGTSLLAGAVAWEILGNRLSDIFLVPLSTTLVDLWGLMESGRLPRALLASAQTFLTGLTTGIVVGVAVGLLLARIRLLRVGLEVYVTALYATPMVVIIPFLLTIVGYGYTSKSIVVFLFAVFPMIINVFEGARSVDPRLVEVAQSFRSSERAMWRHVILPYTLPFAMSGVRLAIARGLVGMIAAEFFLAVTGLGEVLMVSARRFQTGAVLGTILVISMIGLVLMRIGQRLESRYAVWRGVGAE